MERLLFHWVDFIACVAGNSITFFSCFTKASPADHYSLKSYEGENWHRYNCSRSLKSTHHEWCIKIVLGGIQIISLTCLRILLLLSSLELNERVGTSVSVPAPGWSIYRWFLRWKRDGLFGVAIKWNTWTARAAVASNFVVATLVVCLSDGISQTVFLVASFSRTSSTVVRHHTTGRHIPVQLSSLFIYCALSV